MKNISISDILLPKEQANRVWQILLGVGAVLLVVIVGLYILASAAGVPLEKLSTETATYTDTSFYTGILSNLGIMLWSAAAALGFLGAVLLRGVPRVERFMFASGIATTLLALDNIMLIHDRVIPRHLHVRESIVYVLYILLIAIFLLSFSRLILSATNYPILAVGVLFLFVSAAMGKLLDYSQQMMFIKASFKLAGIAFWMAYYFDTLVRFVNRSRPAE